MKPASARVGADDTAIRLDGLFCPINDRLALDIPILRIAAGERIAIIGPNGAGKSSLLRLFSGFVQATQGEITVLGHRPGAQGRDLRRLRSQVGQVLQGLHLVQRLTVLDNVLIGALGRLSGWRTWARWYRDEDIAEAEAALQRVGLADKADTRVDRLSGGERQKVAIARMLMQRPRLILADEPTAALDPQAAGEICALLVDAAQATGECATLVSVVHNPALLPLLADRVIGLKAGRIAFDLSLEQLDADRLGDLYRNGHAVPDRAEPARVAPDALLRVAT